MVIHKVIHSLWITTKKRIPRDRDRPDVGTLLGLYRDVRARLASGLVPVLQHFSTEWAGGTHLGEGAIVRRTAGWRCWLRIYSRGSSEDFGVPAEEFDEAYLSAKSSQASQDARLPSAHEFGGRTQDHRRSPPTGTQAPGSLTVAAKQTHASD